MRNACETRVEDSGRAHWVSARLRALRAFSFPVSVLPVLVAVAAVRSVAEWDWPVLVASVVGVLSLHAAGNLLNDYFDFRAGVDRKVQGDQQRPGRLLVRGELTTGDVLTEAVVCLGLAALVGLYLLWKCGPGLLWFGAIAALALYAYTGPPFRLKYRALGEPLVFLVFGPLLMLGAAYAQSGRFEWPALVLSIPVGFATTAVLVVNNIRDQEEDRAAGIVTLTQVTGIGVVRALYVVLVVAFVLALAFLGALRIWPRFLVVSPLWLLLVRRPLFSIWRGNRIPDIDARTARFETVVLLFLFAVLLANGGVAWAP